MDKLVFFLTAPIYASEAHILAKLGEPTEEQKQNINRLRNSAVSVFTKYVIRPDGTFNIKKISPCLSMGLSWLYSTASSKLGISIKPILALPPDSIIDWLSIISGFITVREFRQNQLGEPLNDVIDLICRIDFTEIVAGHINAQCFYDLSIAERVFSTGLGSEIFERFRALVLIHSLKELDALPIETALNDIHTYITGINFTITQGDITGYYAGVFIDNADKLAQADHLREILKLYQKKEAVLLSKSGGSSHIKLNPPNIIYNSPYTTDQIKEYVGLILAPLSGLNSNKKAIMSESEYKRLIEYTNHLVLTDTLPENIKPYSQTNISNEHIRYTFYRLHKKLFGTRHKKRIFTEFIHTIFSQFKGTTQDTTFAKASTAPKSYYTDFAGYIGEGD